MKRSEVRNDIQALIEIDLEISGIKPAPDVTRLSALILKHIEGLGMIPTGYKGLVANKKKINPDTDSGRDIQYFRDWEPEDDHTN